MYLYVYGCQTSNICGGLAAPWLRNTATVVKSREIRSSLWPTQNLPFLRQLLSININMWEVNLLQNLSLNALGNYLCTDCLMICENKVKTYIDVTPITEISVYWLSTWSARENVCWYLHVNPAREGNLFRHADCMNDTVLFFLLHHDFFFRRLDEFAQLTFDVILYFQLSVQLHNVYNHSVLYAPCNEWTLCRLR